MVIDYLLASCSSRIFGNGSSKQKGIAGIFTLLFWSYNASWEPLLRSAFPNKGSTSGEERLDSDLIVLPVLSSETWLFGSCSVDAAYSNLSSSGGVQGFSGIFSFDSFYSKIDSVCSGSFILIKNIWSDFDKFKESVNYLFSSQLFFDKLFCLRFKLLFNYT